MRASLRSGPKFNTLWGNLIWRKVVQKLPDLIMIQHLVLLACPLNAIIRRIGFLVNQSAFHCTKSLNLKKQKSERKTSAYSLRRIHGIDTVQESALIRQKLVCRFSGTRENAFEEIACPLNSVLNFVREVLQGTNWNVLFWWIGRWTKVKKLI